MIISVIGKGVVGTATGEGFKRLGHTVAYYDKGDEPLLGDVTFVCTPEDVVPQILEKLMEEAEFWTDGLPTIAVRSTVPPGTCEGFSHVSHNPAFFREAVSEYEFMNPHKIVLGECCRAHGDVLEQLYRPFNVPIIRVNPRTSELIKLASNAYLATQISFWNQVKLIADELGVNSHVVGKVCALDPRISQYGASLHGHPYRGRCLPKDIAQLNTLARKLGVTTVLLEAVKEINNHMKMGGGR